MALPTKTVESLAADLIADLDTANLRDGRLGKVRRYLKNDHDLPYAPQGAKQEYNGMRKKAITNWLPLVSNTFTQGLFIDGYRPSNTLENAKPWSTWQANGMDARQSITTRGAVDYGISFGLTLPGEKKVPVMRPILPTRANAWYEDDDAEWPVGFLHYKGTSVSKAKIYEFADDENVYTLVLDDALGPKIIGGAQPHRLKVTPVVRFRNRLDDEAEGVIRPLITVQDRLNDIVFAILIAVQYASFRQRWATGLAIPMVEVKDLVTGEVIGEEPIEPFESAVDRLWVSDSEGSKFGEFAQTEISGMLNFYLSTVKTLAALAQISPNVMTGDLVNLAAEAMAQLRDSTERQLGEFKTLFGESYEQWFRIAALAGGDRRGSMDTESQVRWRTTETRSFAQVADALGKVATMLEVPVEVLWEMIPGFTDGDVARAKELRAAEPAPQAPVALPTDPAPALAGDTPNPQA